MRNAGGPLLVAMSLLIALMALAVGGIAYYQAILLRQRMREAVTQTRIALATLPDQTLTVPVRIQETFPISAQIPIQEKFEVPIHTVLPISTDVAVPLNIPLLGVRHISIPIRASIPVHIEIVVPVSRTLAVEASLPVDIEVPVRIDLGTIGMEKLVAELDARLAEMEQRLR
ncbi:MAG: hypothetical protein RML46_05480 [Anaerolineae bacterium]|nr:hypothetical protein [Anaerolineae bacterium]